MSAISNAKCRISTRFCLVFMIVFVFVIITCFISLSLSLWLSLSLSSSLSLCNDHCFDKLAVTIWSGSVLFGSGSPTRLHLFDLLCFMVWTFGPISQFPGVQTLDKDTIFSHLLIISSHHHTLLCCCHGSSIHILGQRVREGLTNLRIGLVGIIPHTLPLHLFRFQSVQKLSNPFAIYNKKFCSSSYTFKWTKTLSRK